MAVRRLAVSRPSATTDNSLFTADSEYLVSVIATNTNTSSAGLIRVWVVPAGASSVAEYSQIVYDIEVPISNSYETFRFAINQNDVVYVRSSIANMSFTLNGVQQYDIQLGVGVTSFQPTAPSNPINGQLWVDSDALASTVDSSDYLLKTEAATGYYAKTSSASSGEASTVNINTKPWNMPWGVVNQTILATSVNVATTVTDVLSVTFNAVAGRKYKYTAFGLLNDALSNTTYTYLTNAANAVLYEYYMYFSTSNTYHTKTCQYVETMAVSGSTTRKIRGFTNTSTTTYYGVSVRAEVAWNFIVEDIGPA